MKTTLYWVRHAQALGNTLNTFQGSTDAPLSDTGIRQLEYLAVRFREIPLDALYASPLQRAKETALAAGRHHSLALQTDPRLAELNGGGFEGLTWAEIERTYPAEYRQWNHAPDRFCAPGGERMHDVYLRVCAAADDMVRANAGKTVCVVSHGGALRNYLCAAYGWDYSRLRETGWTDNTSVSIVEYDEAFRPRVVCQNDTSHLPPELVTPIRRHEDNA